MTSLIHASDCALHNAPAFPAGKCDCGAACLLAFVEAWEAWDLQRRPPALPKSVYTTATALVEQIRAFENVTPSTEGAKP